LKLTRFELVNCYLVPEVHGFTLVDASFAGAEKDILAAASAAGAPIRRILPTRAHPDHMGSVDALIARLGTLEIAASQRSVPLLKQPPDTSLKSGEPDKPIKNTPGMKSAVTRTLSEGELYGSLRVIETQGISPDISLSSMNAMAPCTLVTRWFVSVDFASPATRRGISRQPTTSLGMRPSHSPARRSCSTISSPVSPPDTDLCVMEGATC
jgi:hypothetical protein